jgi:CubicO group peptidase (beta-lactamase class C family)
MCRRAQETVICLIVFLASLVAVTAAEATSFGLKADEYLLRLTGEGQFSGTVLVATNGEVSSQKVMDWANREHDIANTTNTIFRLGSVTKQFTAMCIGFMTTCPGTSCTNTAEGSVVSGAR